MPNVRSLLGTYFQRVRDGASASAGDAGLHAARVRWRSHRRKSDAVSDAAARIQRTRVTRKRAAGRRVCCRHEHSPLQPALLHRDLLYARRMRWRWWRQCAKHQRTGIDVRQLIADGATGSAPTPIGSQSGLPVLTASSLRGNGILGVGPFTADCGAGCASSELPHLILYVHRRQLRQRHARGRVAGHIRSPTNNGMLIDLPVIAATGALSTPQTFNATINSTRARRRA